LAFAASIAAGLAAVATFSRQWLPAAGLGLVTLALLEHRTATRSLAWAGATAGLVGLLFVSGALDGAYFAERFGRLAEGGREQNVALRLERQASFLTESGETLTGAAAQDSGQAAAPPAAAAGQSPASTSQQAATSRVERLKAVHFWQTIFGRGFANADLIDRQVVDEATADYLRGGFNDNVFLLETRNHGIPAGLLYVTLLVIALRSGLTAVRQGSAAPSLLVGLSASVVAAVSLHFFDNYFSEAVFMKGLLWLLVGLLVGLAAAPGKASGLAAPRCLP
jgi:hypothetical protein